MTKQTDTIKQIIDYIKEHPKVRTAFQVEDDRIVVDLEDCNCKHNKWCGACYESKKSWILDQNCDCYEKHNKYTYTGKGYRTGSASPRLTVGKTYKIIDIRDRRLCEGRIISIRDDKGVKRWYSPLFIERSFMKV